jgi:alanine racemase
MQSQPRAWADVDLDAISRNLVVVREQLGTGKNVMLVVKADAYGHGAIAIARHVVARGEVEAFGVGDSEEALELRDAGIDAPILVLGAIVDGEMGAVVANEIAVTVHSNERLRKLEVEARRQGKPCRVHVKVDTGMGRLGPFSDYALNLARAAAASDWIVLEGVGSHFSSSSRPEDGFTRVQIERFREFLARLRALGVEPKVIHCANSGGVLHEDVSAFDMVRVGAAALGIYPRFDGAAAKLAPALALRTQIIYMKDVPAGTPISYNRLHVTASKTRIATIPIGYNDGLPYSLTGKGRALVRGRVVPIVGAITMDYCMLDVGKVPGVRTGDRVTLIGQDGEHKVTVQEIAAALDTVPYEITCGLGRRVKRIHRPERPHPGMSSTVERNRPAEPARPETRDPGMRFDRPDPRVPADAGGDPPSTAPIVAPRTRG